MPETPAALGTITAAVAGNVCTITLAGATSFVSMEGASQTGYYVQKQTGDVTITYTYSNPVYFETVALALLAKTDLSNVGQAYLPVDAPAVQLNFNANYNPNQQVAVHRAPVVGGVIGSYTYIGLAGANSFIDASIAYGNIYAYYLQNAIGQSTAVVQIDLTQIPANPVTVPLPTFVPGPPSSGAPTGLIAQILPVSIDMDHSGRRRSLQPGTTARANRCWRRHGRLQKLHRPHQRHPAHTRPPATLHTTAARRHTTGMDFAGPRAAAIC